VSADKPPLLFERSLGSLRPINPAAHTAVTAIPAGQRVEVRIVKGGRNLRRLAFYWSMLNVASQHLQDRVEGPLDAGLLHKLLKRKLELGTWTRLPSGERVFDEDSIGFAQMSEPERAAWVDRVRNVLATWLQVPPEILMDEARSAAA
jgi:hypothetical protein